ncbi:hypothetical protein E3N88_28714 [Mikania micrantha]|uniref:Uncharacterized protein n=1 Tax=Mikania micrantha TaxID=192012 RepID=A0A5N6N088_9ASTR|nr:hypothetical protein E3N88_28714 [Mikania micrantha]
MPIPTQLLPTFISSFIQLEIVTYAYLKLICGKEKHRGFTNVHAPATEPAVAEEQPSPIQLDPVEVQVQDTSTSDSEDNNDTQSPAPKSSRRRKKTMERRVGNVYVNVAKCKRSTLDDLDEDYVPSVAEPTIPPPPVFTESTTPLTITHVEPPPVSDVGFTRMLTEDFEFGPSSS